MLKLLKYELKQTWKMCATLLGSTLFGCMALIWNPLNNNSVIFVLYVMLFGLVVIGSSIALFFYCMGSFNQEFTQPQGYLMMTLPITAREFIWAKFINQLIWNGLCGLTVTGTFLFFVKDRIAAELVSASVKIPGLLQVVMKGLSSYLLTIFIVYFSIAVLSIQPSNRNNNFIKVMLSIALSYGIGMIIGLIAIFTPYTVQYGIPMNLADIEQFGLYIQNNMDGVNRIEIIITLIISSIFYLATEHIIAKKVQL